VLPPLLDLVERQRADPVLFVATGTHRACTEAELEDMVGPRIRSRVEVVQHDAFDAARHEEIGRLSDTGTPILVEREFLDCDVRITTGFIEPHFFAGFSGGPKLVAPGLAALQTTLDLHSARRIGSERATWAVTHGNPVHDAVREIAALARVTFNLDVAINRDRQVTGVFAGDLFESHRTGCEFVRRTAMAAVERPFDVVVATNSGYPLDQSLYQTVKGMSAAAQIVRDGGTIVMASECSDGLPSHGRYGELLRAAPSPAAFLELLSDPGFSAHDQWQVQVQARIRQKARVLLRSDGLRPGDVPDAWVEPIEDVAEAVAALPAGSTIAVLPEGPQTIPHVAGVPNRAGAGSGTS
jgi:nickel-dependent lactate racemase